MASKATTDHLILDREDRELLASVCDLAIATADALGLTLHGARADVEEMRERLAPWAPTLQTRRIPDLVDLVGPETASKIEDDITRSASSVGFTRPQELAADAMAAKYGRSGVQPQADGSAVICGMIDDIELETVCIETDGRERWRR